MTKTVIRPETLKSNELTAKEKDTLLLAKGGGIAFGGNLSTTIIQFFFGLVLARLLGAELLGLYALSSTVTSLLVVLSSLGIGAGLVRFIPIAIGEKDDARLWGIIQIGIALPALISIILSIGVFLLAEPIAIKLFNRADFIPILRLACLGIPFLVLMSMLSSITQGFKHMEYRVFAEDLTFNLLKLALAVVFIVAGLSVLGVVLAHNIAVVVAVGMFFFFVHRLLPLNRPINQAKRNVREMLEFSLPVYLTRVLSRFSGSIESLILGALSLIGGLGIYSTVLRLSGVGKMFHHAMQSIAMPMISDLHSRGELVQLSSVYRTTAKWGMTFNLPIFMVIILFSETILSIFGTEFIAGEIIFPILAFATLFNASTGVCGSMITMTGHTRLTFTNSLINLGMNIILDLALIPRFGIIGAAIAVTLTEVFINVLRIIQVKFLLNIIPYDRSFIKPLMASLIAFGITLLVRPWLRFLPVLLQLVISALLLCVIFVFVIMILKLSDEDRLVLNKLLARFNFRRS